MDGAGASSVKSGRPWNFRAALLRPPKKSHTLSPDFGVFLTFRKHHTFTVHFFRYCYYYFFFKFTVSRCTKLSRFPDDLCLSEWVLLSFERLTRMFLITHHIRQKNKTKQTVCYMQAASFITLRTAFTLYATPQCFPRILKHLNLFISDAGKLTAASSWREFFFRPSVTCGWLVCPSASKRDDSESVWECVCARACVCDGKVGCNF